MGCLRFEIRLSATWTPDYVRTCDFCDFRSTKLATVAQELEAKEWASDAFVDGVARTPRSETNHVLHVSTYVACVHMCILECRRAILNV